jgi:hypothetical protein
MYTQTVNGKSTVNSVKANWLWEHQLKNPENKISAFDSIPCIAPQTQVCSPDFSVLS